MRIKIFIWLIIVFGLSFPQLSQAQIANEVAGGGTFHNLTTVGICKNTGVSIPAGQSLSADGLPACVGGAAQDSWFNVVSNTTGNLTFAFTPQADANVAIAVYNGANSSAVLLGCANNFAATDLSTEVISVPTTSGNTYTVRIFNIGASGAYVGKLSMYPTVSNDLPIVGTFHNLSLGICENVMLGVPATQTVSADAIPTCNSTIGAITQDSWFSVVSNTTGILAFSITPTANADLAIAIYDGSTSTNMLNCANKYAGANLSTETVLISAVSGNTYTVRLMNLTTPANTAYTANLSIYAGPISQQDLCLNANSVAIGTCGYAFEVEDGFIHNESNRTSMTTSAGTKTIFADGWLKIDLAQNKRVRVEYANGNKDAAIQIYRSTTNSCGALTLVTETNEFANSSRPESLEFNATLAGTNTYFIRICNIADDEAMGGDICIEEVIARDNCNDLTLAINGGNNHAASLELGDCGVRVTIFPNPIFSSDNDMSSGFPACDVVSSSGNPNVWVKYTATATTRVRLEFSSEDGKLIGLAVSAGTICGSMSPISTSECLEATGSDSQAISFNVTSGTTYYVELGSSTPTNPLDSLHIQTVTGYLCLYEDAKKSEDVFYAANSLDATGQDCGVIFNIPSTFEATGDGQTPFPSTLGLANPLGGCSGGLTSYSDAWGTFQIATGALPTAGMLVEFDNNDSRSSTTAVDVALQVFKGGTIQTASNVDDNTCALADAATTTINVNTFVKNLAVNQDNVGQTVCTLTTDKEKWVRYVHPVSLGATTVRVSFKSSATPNFAVAIYSSCGGAELACGGKGTSIDHTSGFSDLATATFAATAGTEYFIRVASVGATNITGDLSVSVASALTLMGCSNTINEGNESVLLSGASFTDNTQYYLRIVRIEDPLTGLKTVTGRACLRDNSVPQGDLCSNAISLLVGDCDINLDLTGDALGEDKFVNNQTVPIGSNFPTVGRDGWITFTATASRTTVEYTQNNTTQDAAIEIYRGTCAALQRLNNLNTSPVVRYADDIALGATGVEKFVFESVPGVVYYARIIKKGASSNMVGKLCVYKTVARDACIDNDLITLGVGACNYTIDVPRSFDTDVFLITNTPPNYRDFSTNLPITEIGGSLVQYTETSCENPFNTGANNNPGLISSRDGWFRLLGNGNEVTITFGYTESGTNTQSNPSIVVYTALNSVGPVNCGTGLNGANNPENQYACGNNVTANGTQTETVTFRTNGGQQYLIRILDLNAAAGKDMSGTLCISDGRTDYNESCTSSLTGPREVAIGSCTVPLNVLNTGTTTCSSPATTIVGGAYDDNNAGTLCDNCVNRDAWAVITRPFVCDPTAVGATVPTVHTFGDGTQIISCPRPFRVNLGTDGAIGGSGTALDKCECGNEATNTCEPPTINAGTPSTGGTCNCPTGYTCYDNDGSMITDNDRRCIPLGYVQNFGKNAVFDVNGYDDYFTPVATNGVCPSPYSTHPGTDNTLGTGDDYCVCTQQTIRTTHPTSFTIEYDNRNGVSEVAADYSMLVYQTTNCDNENNFTRLACKYPASAPTTEATIERIESHTITGLSVAHGAGGETYYVRILNKTVGKTLLGNMCVYYGTDVANTSCTSFPLSSYGELEGEFKNFTVASETLDANRNLPSTTIPNCVLAGGSTPVSASPNPIRADSWMQFDVPVGANYTGVSIQFDNTNAASLRNVAIAVYTSPEIPTGTTSVRDNGTTNLSLNCLPYGAGNPVATANPNRGGLFLLDCQDAVYNGVETMTINTTYSNGAQPSSVPITTARTYYVRVMNVHNENPPTAFTGRIRVFPAATCNLSTTDLVVDGDFNMWPSVDYSSVAGGRPNNMTVANTNAATNAFITARNGAIMRVPNITTNDPYPNDIDGVFGASSGAAVNTGAARFATDYGYARESGTYMTGNQRITYGNAVIDYQELLPEGQYTVRQSPWTLYAEWFSFGVGYSGYGGRVQPSSRHGSAESSYCLTGIGTGNEPCQVITLGNTITTVGAYNTTNNRVVSGGPATAFNTNGLPAAILETADANFLVVNGSYNADIALSPGKVWCQTVRRADADVNDISYYMFSIWVQNLVSGGRNLDVPQMRMTVCDMENPNSAGSFPPERDLYTTDNGDTGADNQRMTRLPGITDATLVDNTASVTDGNFTNANSASGVGRFPEESLAQRVRHLPRPDNNRMFALVSGGPRPSSYGANMPCNLSQNNGWTGANNINESSNARLKILGSTFLVPEQPDNWVLIRCIYRAPRTVKEMNLCIENTSFSKVGNNFGLDRISFRKCENADAETFDRLLKGDPCALSTDGVLTGIPLMATLLEFSATLMGDKVGVLWTTMNEADMSHYLIQRSIDGVNFTSVGTKDAKVMAQGGYNNYEFIDSNLPLGVKQIFYRLIMVSKTGLEKNTSVVSVEIPSIENFDLKLKPNPVSRGGEFSLGYHALQAGQASIVITDVMGNRLRKQLVTLQAGNGEITMKTGNLQAGLYIVQMMQGSKIGTKKLVIQ